MLTQELGQQAEQDALEYLSSKGLKLVYRNYSCRLGEIDLIMRDGAYLVFIEVRSRTHKAYGDGLDSITYAKRQKIIKTTSHYLIRYKIQDKYPVRFDVISIDGKNKKLTWVKDAFSTEY